MTFELMTTDLIGSALTASQTAYVTVGGSRVDAVPVFYKSGTAAGKLTANTRNGKLKYQLKKASLLNAFTAQGVSTTESGSNDVSIYVIFNGRIYGGSYQTFYATKPSKTIKGKF